MEQYHERKKALIKRHIIATIEKYDRNVAQNIEIYDLRQSDVFLKYVQEKMNYARYGWEILKRNSDESNLLDNLFQIVELQNRRIVYLESQMEKQNSKREIKEDLDKIKEAYRIISNDLEEKKDSKNGEVVYGKRLKLAIFTPLPPLKNGIADYSVDVITELYKYFDIDVFVDDTYRVNGNLFPEKCREISHKKFSEYYPQYDAILYQIGNNPHHTYMVPYVLKYPGIIVLHDFKLGYLRTFLNKGLQKYCDVNCSSAMQFEARRLENPYNLYLIKKAKAILVHSEYSALGVLEQDLSKNVQIIPHYSKCSPLKQDNHSLREKYKLKDEIVIASFGFVTVSKRIPSVLRALAKILRMYPEIPVRYFLVGSVDDSQKEVLRKTIITYKLEKYVTVTGYVPLNVFEEYMEITDICINLRCFYAGETSGTVSRMLGKGKACIVTDVGSFSEIPDNCCIKIPDALEDEVRNLFFALKHLIQTPQLIKKLGESGQNYVQRELSLEKVGRMYRDFIYNSLNHAEKNILCQKLERLAGFIACNDFHHENTCIQWLNKQLLKEFCNDYFSK